MAIEGEGKEEGEQLSILVCVGVRRLADEIADEGGRERDDMPLLQ